MTLRLYLAARLSCFGLAAPEFPRELRHPSRFPPLCIIRTQISLISRNDRLHLIFRERCGPEHLIVSNPVMGLAGYLPSSDRRGQRHESFCLSEFPLRRFQGRDNAAAAPTCAEVGRRPKSSRDIEVARLKILRHGIYVDGRVRVLSHSSKSPLMSWLRAMLYAVLNSPLLSA